jgi:hypothetical protein
LFVNVELAEKETISIKEFEMLWDWIGPALKKIRYQKYLLWLFENGFVVGNSISHKRQNETTDRKRQLYHVSSHNPYFCLDFLQHL